MSELIDKLERAEKGATQPLGFGGAAKRERIAPLLLLGAVTAGDAKQAKTVIAAGLDGAIIVGTSPAKKVDIDKSAKAFKGITFGVWVDEGQAKEAAGADFQIFSSHATSIGAIAGEERTTIMQVAPELDDSLLRTIDLLPVDAFFVSLADAESLTISQLMRLGRVRGVTSRWMLAYLPSLPSKEEAEQLRDAGITALVVGAASHTTKALQDAHAMLLDIPREAPKQKDRAAATVPTFQGPSAPATPSPEPQEDDWDDD